jgi:hypothetical protein
MGKVKFFEQAEATQEPVLLKVRTKSGSLIITPTQVRGEPVWEWLRTAQTKALKHDQITSVEHRNLGIIFSEAIIGVCFDALAVVIGRGDLPGVRALLEDADGGDED